MMMCTVNVHDHAVSQASRFRVILFLFDIVMRLVQQRAGLVQASGPRIVRVHGNVISNVLAVIVCRLLDFSDGMVDLFDRGALLSVQNAAVGALQVRPGIAQIGKGVQVSWMLALRAENLRREREQECDRRGDHSNSGRVFIRIITSCGIGMASAGDGTAALPCNPVKHAAAAFVVGWRRIVSIKATRGGGPRWGLCQVYLWK